MKIYTKTGDKGETSFIGGRLSKSHILFEVIGTLDELNSILGVCAVSLKSSKDTSDLLNFIIKIQNNLFSIGGIFAGSGKSFSEVSSKEVEKNIDSLDKSLPPLTNFILPGGGATAGFLHHARAICRRLERIIDLFNDNCELQKLQHNYKYRMSEESLLEIIIYINRLSDWIFTAARFVNFKEGINEVVWDTNRHEKIQNTKSHK